MYKSEEIEALTKFTESLPRDSYLRPWLEDVLPQVVADIRNDFPVAPSLTITRHECNQLRNAANIEAHAIIEKATRKAADIERQATEDTQSRRTHLANDLRNALRQLGFSSY